MHPEIVKRAIFVMNGLPEDITERGTNLYRSEWGTTILHTLCYNKKCKPKREFIIWIIAQSRKVHEKIFTINTYMYIL